MHDPKGAILKYMAVSQLSARDMLITKQLEYLMSSLYFQRGCTEAFYVMHICHHCTQYTHTAANGSVHCEKSVYQKLKIGQKNDITANCLALILHKV